MPSPLQASVLFDSLSSRKLLAGVAAFGLLACALLAAAPALAVVELNITQGKIQALPIAIPDFVGDGSVDPEIGRAHV